MAVSSEKKWSSVIATPPGTPFPKAYRFRTRPPDRLSPDGRVEFEVRFKGRWTVWVIAPDEPVMEADWRLFVEDALGAWADAFVEGPSRVDYDVNVKLFNKAAGKILALDRIEFSVPMPPERYATFAKVFRTDSYRNPATVVRRDRRLDCVLLQIAGEGDIGIPGELDWAARHHPKKLVSAFMSHRPRLYPRAKVDRHGHDPRVGQYARAVCTMLRSGCDAHIYKALEAEAVRVCKEHLRPYDSRKAKALETLILENRFAEWDLPGELVRTIETYLESTGSIWWSDDDLDYEERVSGHMITHPQNWDSKRCAEVWRQARGASRSEA